MTRQELQQKLTALSGAGDAAARATLQWLDELTTSLRLQSVAPRPGTDGGRANRSGEGKVPDCREPEDLSFLKPIADFVAAADSQTPPVDGKTAASVVTAADGSLVALRVGDLRAISDRFNHTVEAVRKRMVETSVAAAATDGGFTPREAVSVPEPAFFGEFPAADPIAMGKGEAAPPAARNLDGYGNEFSPEAQERHAEYLRKLNTEHAGVGPTPADLSEAERVAAAATRQANGMPAETDPEVLKPNTDAAAGSHNAGTGV